MRLRNRLLLAYAAVLLVAAIGLGMAVTAINQLARISDAMLEQNFRAIDLSAQLRTLISAQHIALTHRLIDGRGSMVELMAPFVDEAGQLVRSIRTYSRHEEERLAISGAEQALAALASMSLDLDHDLDQDQGTVLLTAVDAQRLLDAFNDLRIAAETAYTSNFRQVQGRAAQVARETRQLSVAVLLVALFTVLVGLLASLRLSRALSAPMERFALAAAQVAGGDYRVRIGHSNVEEIDEMGRRFNEMTAALESFHAMRLDEILAGRRRLDTVIDGIDQGLVIIDERGWIERINPVAERQLGCSKVDSGSVRASDLLAGTPVPEQVVQILTDGVPEGALPAGDFPRVVDDRTRTLAWTLTPFSDAQRLGLVLMLRDISEERELERMRTEFVMRAAHELRTPITGMRMALGLVQDRLEAPPGSRDAELLETIKDEMERMVRLIANLLDLARLYNNSVELQRRHVDVDQLMTHARDRFRGPAEASGLALRLDVEPGLPKAYVDPDQFDRVLDNLLSNAVRHTLEGGTIELQARRIGTILEFAVADDGEGIAAAQRSRIFEPFVQVGRSTGGAGMGLAMSREIIQQHGGRLYLDPATGVGCRFVISLPL